MGILSPLAFGAVLASRSIAERLFGIIQPNYERCHARIGCRDRIRMDCRRGFVCLFRKRHGNRKAFKRRGYGFRLARRVCMDGGMMGL